MRISVDTGDVRHETIEGALMGLETAFNVTSYAAGIHLPDILFFAAAEEADDAPFSSCDCPSSEELPPEEYPLSSTAADDHMAAWPLSALATGSASFRMPLISHASHAVFDAFKMIDIAHRGICALFLDVGLFLKDRASGVYFNPQRLSARISSALPDAERSVSDFWGVPTTHCRPKMIEVTERANRGDECVRAWVKQGNVFFNWKSYPMVGPADLQKILIHELTHVLQCRIFASTSSGRDRFGKRDIRRSIREGMACFSAETLCASESTPLRARTLEALNAAIARYFSPIPAQKSTSENEAPRGRNRLNKRRSDQGLTVNPYKTGRAFINALHRAGLSPEEMLSLFKKEFPAYEELFMPWRYLERIGAKAKLDLKIERRDLVSWAKTAVTEGMRATKAREAGIKAYTGKRSSGRALVWSLLAGNIKDGAEPPSVRRRRQALEFLPAPRERGIILIEELMEYHGLSDLHEVEAAFALCPPESWVEQLGSTLPILRPDIYSRLLRATRHLGNAGDALALYGLYHQSHTGHDPAGEQYFFPLEKREACFQDLVRIAGPRLGKVLENMSAPAFYDLAYSIIIAHMDIQALKGLAPYEPDPNWRD